MTNPSETPAHRYSPELAATIEKTWQKFWIDNGTFNAPNPVGDLAPTGGETLPEEKLFVQDMFPFPSGAGLHVGHPLGYIATDVFGRYNRMLGKNVLHTLGYDAFGLPAEQYAIQTGTHPRVKTQESINNMERQLGRLGLAHDKRRAVATTDVEFYRWTQWIFLQIFNAWFDPAQQKARPIAELHPLLESGEVTVPEELAVKFGTSAYAELTPQQKAEVVDSFRLVYRTNSLVNWCPGLGTVLANEEVTADGRSERGNFPVFRKNLSQWMMRITAYADRLLVLPSASDAEGEGAAPVMEMDKLLQVAERFGLARQFDRYKINTLIQDILSYEGEQRALQCYIALSTDTLLDETFPEWIDGQLRATGIAPNQIVFELKLENLANGFTGAVHLINKMRPQGCRFALADVGRMDTTVREMLERVKPEIIKLDMREIDTFEDREEEEFMREVKKYAEEHHTMLIADHMESPAQLSRVWPHDIQYIQGDGIVPPMDKFAFDFNEPLF